MGEYRELYNYLRDDPYRMEIAIRDVVRTSQQDVIADILKQSQIFMQWSYLHVLADMDAKRAKLRLNEEVAVECREQAEHLLHAEGRKATVSAIQDKAASLEAYKAAQEDLLRCEERAAILRAVVESLRQKKDMLQSLNSRQRVELGDYRNEYVPREPVDVGAGDYNEDLREQKDEGPTQAAEEDQGKEDYRQLAARYRAVRRSQRG